MKPEIHENICEEDPNGVQTAWIVAYENYIVRGGPKPEGYPKGLSKEAQQQFDEARSTIDALHQAFGNDSNSAEQPTKESPPQQLGDFRILHEIGRGGMGVVYEAEQISLPRRVALKILPFAAVLDPRQLERFKNEARAAATLDHPGIVSIYSVGCEHDVHFFAMQFIEGQSLAEVIEELQHGVPLERPDAYVSASVLSGLTEEFLTENSDLAVPLAEKETTEGTLDDTDKYRTPASSSTGRSDASKDLTNKPTFFRFVARLGAQTAEALDHAHTHGIIHRDVKPGNLLLDAEGNLHVADFGLARIEAEAGVTMTGDILGTLRYMSPEQALARRAVVDQRTDIYSLGATLYEMITLTPPLEGHDRQELLRKIAFEEPSPPRKLNADVPIDLETIVLKAIAKNPTDRYLTAQEMADDLNRFSNGQPVRARRIGPPERLWRWSRRNPAVSVLTATVAALATMVATVAMIGYARTNMALSQVSVERDTAQAERKDAIEQRNAARQNQYYAEIVAGQTQVDSGNPGGLHVDLIDHLPLQEEEDIRGWEWYYLMSKCRPEERTINYPGLQPFAAWSPDGKYIGTPGAIWEADTGKCIRRFSTSNIRRYRVAWSPNGQKFAWAIASSEDAFYIYDLLAGKLSRFTGHKKSVWCLAWSPDGLRIASGSLDGTIKIWDVATKTIQWTSTDIESAVKSLAWSPNGKLLVACIGRRSIKVWDVAKQKLFDKKLGPGTYNSVSWHPKENMLAVSGNQGWYLLETENWKIVHEVVLPRAGKAISYSPDGSLIAVAHGETVSIWNSTGEMKVADLSGHRNPVYSLSWHPDGRRLVSGDESREVKLWDLDRQESATLATKSNIGSIMWLDDNETLLLVGEEDRSTTLWGIRDDTPIRQETIAVKDSITVNFDRTLAAVYDEDKHTLSIRNSSNGENRSIVKVDPERHFDTAAFSRDGLKVVVQSHSHSENVLHIEVWNVDREQLLWTWKSKNGRLRNLTWNADGSHFAAVGFGDLGENGSVYWRDHLHIFDVNQGKRVVKYLPAGGRGRVTVQAWSRDGRYVALGTEGGHLEVVEVENGRRFFTKKIHHDSITALAWHPLDNRLAAATHDGEVKITSRKEGKVLVNFTPFQDPVVTLAWSSDGQRLAAATSQGEVQTWDAGPAYDLTSGDVRIGELAWAYYDKSREASEEIYAASLKTFLRYAPDNLGFWQACGNASAELGEFDRAAAEFAKAIGQDLKYSYSPACYRTGALLGAGHVEEFHRACEELVEAFQDSPVPSSRGRVAWLASLTSNPLVDSAKLVAMARVSMDKNGPDTGDEWQLILGGALYRDGQHEEANRLLAELATKLGSDGDWKTNYEVACAKYLLCMSRLSLGHKFQSRRLLEEACEIADAYLELVPGRYWEKIVALRTLRREATLMIEE